MTKFSFFSLFCSIFILLLTTGSVLADKITGEGLVCLGQIRSKAEVIKLANIAAEEDACRKIGILIDSKTEINNALLSNEQITSQCSHKLQKTTVLSADWVIHKTGLSSSDDCYKIIIQYSVAEDINSYEKDTSTLLNSEDKGLVSHENYDSPQFNFVNVKTPTKYISVSDKEITLEQWQETVGNIHSPYDEIYRYTDKEIPIAYLSPKLINSFLTTLSKKHKKSFRLLKESEWESICKSGTDGLDLNKIAHFEMNQVQTSTGVTKDNNGLYNILGNVWEIVSSDTNDSLIIKGGGYGSNSDTLNCLKKEKFQPIPPKPNIGLRIVRE
ncbi:formylglycine-generating enzyme family protein [Maridesulfovibrio sp. FT414]|uniref:formylglycine-generating enzyme family protein n=1 Tax=Maridesulfovibrio sp. FT414 TaxID=2979469 RepID=UPI003D8094AC